MTTTDRTRAIWPTRPLLEAIARRHEYLNRLPNGNMRRNLYRADQLTTATADRYAIALGFMPHEVWPDWYQLDRQRETARQERTPRVPAGMVHPSKAAVLAACLGPGRHTVRSVAAAAGLGMAAAHAHLVDLRADGMVTWEDGWQGTLRATCTAVPVGTEHDEEAV